MELLRKLYKKEVKPELDYFFLAGVVLFFSLLRIPSVVEPDWYGDEGIYQVIGRAINSGRMLYSGIWDNKPPFLYLLYAAVDGDLFLIRLLSLIFGAAAVIVFFFLARNIFTGNRISIYLSTISFAFLFGLPLLEGNIANAENFMLFPILLSLFLITKLKSSSSILLPISSGLLLSTAFLTKIVAVFDLSAFILILFTLRFFDKPFFYVFSRKNQSSSSNKNLIDVKKHFLSKPIEFLKVLKQELFLLIAFVVPVIVTAIFFLIVGAFPDFFRAAFSQNVGYVGYANLLSVNLGSIQASIPQGVLYLKMLGLFISVIIVVIFRKKLGRSGIVIYLWMVFSLFNAFFSGRPYTHYVLVALPAFCLFFGLLFKKMDLRIKVLHVFIFLLVLLLLRTNFWIYTKIVPYYSNYYDFMNNKKSLENYQAFFDRITPRDYEIARFIELNTTPSDNVFLVSDSGQIYYLADKLPPGRYIVSYHITFYKDGISETLSAIDGKKPKYVIVTKDGNLKENFLADYNLRYIFENVDIYEREN